MSTPLEGKANQGFTSASFGGENIVYAGKLNSSANSRNNVKISVIPVWSHYSFCRLLVYLVLKTLIFFLDWMNFSPALERVGKK